MLNPRRLRANLGMRAVLQEVRGAFEPSQHRPTLEVFDVRGASLMPAQELIPPSPLRLDNRQAVQPRPERDRPTMVKLLVFGS